jgi:hypothetical protein
MIFSLNLIKKKIKYLNNKLIIRFLSKRKNKKK